jgi:hypothetical protein
VRAADATQLPDLRNYLIGKWQTGPWFEASVRAHSIAPEQYVYEMPEMFRDMTPERQAINDCGTEVRLLQESTLWWVGPEMCDLLFDALNSVPEETRIEHLDMPSGHGLVRLAKPWAQALDPNDPTKKISVDAFVWGKTNLHPVASIEPLSKPGSSCLSLSAYRYLDFDMGMVSNELGLAAEYDALNAAHVKRKTLKADEKGNISYMIEGGDWVPLGRSDWPDSQPLGTPLPVNPRHVADNDPVKVAAFKASSVQDRRIMSALFALLKSPGISHIGEYTPSRQVVRQAQRKGRPVPSPVKMVYLRRPSRKGEPSTHEGEENHYGHRFIVRAHLRLQAYGPGRKQRKLITVGPFIKGPEGTPLVTKETVHAWIR